MKILLVRHGESLANVDLNVYKTSADHDIALTERGVEQAEYAGEFLKAYFEKEYVDLLDPNKTDQEKTKTSLNKMMKSQGYSGEFGDLLEGMFTKVSESFGGNFENFKHELFPKIKMYNSPYKRARQTAEEIKKVMGSLLTDSQEDVLLGEKNFGSLNGLEDDEYATFFPKEAECYNQVRNSTGGKLFARAGQAESGLDVIVRLRLVIAQLKEDNLEQGIDNFIVVCHGDIVRLFTMAFCNFRPEWYDTERSPANCSVRLLDNKMDHGYILSGWKHGKKC